ncbi:hypothetical protein V8D89_010281 [Ganoderma adspersum]
MAKGSKKNSLKAALSSQQSRLKKKQEVAQATQHAERLRSSPQSKAKGNAAPPSHIRTTIPFSSTDNILLIGEGNFSFARALISSPSETLQFLPPSNVTATAYDTEEECCSKYPDAAEIITALREKGVQLIFGVDATKLDKCPPLRGRAFDRVVWNFPHAGKRITDQDRNILINQMLILGFLRSVAPFLAAGPVPVIQKPRKKKGSDEEDSGDDDKTDALHNDASRKARGTVLITLRNVVPYTLWDLPKLAKTPPPPSSAGQNLNPKYIQLRSFVFRRNVWAGYEHRMTKGERAHGQGKTGEGGEDRTWEFCIQD